MLLLEAQFMKTAQRKKITRGYINPYRLSSKRTPKHWINFLSGKYTDTHRYALAPEGFEYPQEKKELIDTDPKVTWINHSTFLIQHQNLNILTDPIWSDRCSPFSFVGPLRQHKAGLDFESLPRIDLVLLSHNHFDHLDKPTVKALNKKFPNIFWIVPKGVAKWFRKLKITQVLEFSWWEHIKLLDRNLKITCVPAQHFSGRHLFNLNQTLWCGFVCEFLDTSKKIYFAGDTGYNPVQFKQIGETFHEIDLSLIPIGAYAPKEFMEPIHVSPREAVHIHQEVGSKLSVGSHFKTFRLTQEGAEQPPFDLYCSMEEAELDHNTFRVLQPGETINW